MRKMKKVIIMIISFNLLFFGIASKKQQAEASVTGLVLTGTGTVVTTLGGLAALAPGLVVAAVVGLGAVALGYTIDNWDYIILFGQNVINNMAKKGIAIGEFVNGYALTFSAELKQAMLEESLTLPESVTVVEKNTTYLGPPASDSVRYAGLPLPMSADSRGGSRYVIFNKNLSIASYSADLADMSQNYHWITQIFTIRLYIDPVVDNGVDFVARGNNYGGREEAGPIGSRNRINTTTEKIYENGLLSAVDVTLTFNDDVLGTAGSIWSLNLGQTGAVQDNIFVNGYFIPDLGVGERHELSSKSVTKNIFPEKQRPFFFDKIVRDDETVVFNSGATLTGAGVKDFPSVSDKVFTAEQEVLVNTTIPAALESGKNASDIAALDGKFAVMSTAVSGLQTRVNNIMDNLSNLPGAIISGIASLFSWLQGLLTNIWNAILGIPAAVAGAMSGLWEDAGLVWDGIKASVDNMHNTMVDSWAQSMDNYANGIDSIRTYLGGLLDSIRTGIDGGLTNLGTLVTNLSTTFTNTMTNIGTWVQSIPESIATATDKLIGVVVPTDLAMEEYTTKMDELKLTFTKKFEFITLPIASIKEIFASPKSLYDVHFTIEDTRVYVLPKVFKPAVDVAKNVLTGAAVISTFIGIYRRFTPKEVIA